MLDPVLRRGAAPALRAAICAAALIVGFLPAAWAEEGAEAAGPVRPLEWQKWQADNVIGNVASLQRGARNFMGYCSGCHSLKYQRYSRLGEDLNIPEAVLNETLLLPGDRKSDYIMTRLGPDDATAWFGKAPPDLSLITRAKGENYVYQFLKTFYADPASPTGVNNLALSATAMPHVLADLQGVQDAVYHDFEAETRGKDGKPIVEAKVVKLELGVTGRLSPEQYDQFVRDTVNFLSYVGEPAQAQRVSTGIWVVVFLLAFTGLAYMLKQEYWKDIK